MKALSRAPFIFWILTSWRVARPFPATKPLPARKNYSGKGRVYPNQHTFIIHPTLQTPQGRATLRLPSPVSCLLYSCVPTSRFCANFSSRLSREFLPIASRVLARTKFPPSSRLFQLLARVPHSLWHSHPRRVAFPPLIRGGTQM